MQRPSHTTDGSSASRTACLGVPPLLRGRRASRTVAASTLRSVPLDGRKLDACKTPASSRHSQYCFQEVPHVHVSKLESSFTRRQ